MQDVFEPLRLSNGRFYCSERFQVEPVLPQLLEGLPADIIPHGLRVRPRARRDAVFQVKYFHFPSRPRDSEGRREARESRSRDRDPVPHGSPRPWKATGRKNDSPGGDPEPFLYRMIGWLRT